MGSKGLRALTQLLSQGNWPESVTILDLSDNPLGSKGSEVLASTADGYLCNRTLKLDQLALRRCDLEVDRITAGLLSEKSGLIHTTMSMLDLSGNRVTTKALSPLTQLVARSQYVTSQIYYCHMNLF